MHLVRHPLAVVLVGLVALFALFFVVLPALALLAHLALGIAIIWAVVSLLRFHRRHQARTRPH